MLDFIVSLILALAFFQLGVAISRGDREFAEKGFKVLIFSFFLIGLAGFILIEVFGINLIIRKIVAVILILFGLFMVFEFPRPGNWQPEQFALLGMIIGWFCLFLGIYWLFF